jgi:hypothetical protein
MSTWRKGSRPGPAIRRLAAKSGKDLAPEFLADDQLSHTPATRGNYTLRRSSLVLVLQFFLPPTSTRTATCDFRKAQCQKGGSVLHLLLRLRCLGIPIFFGKLS